MRTPTLIPEADSYGIVLLVTYCLASYSLSAHAYSRWLATRGIPFVVVHGIVLSVISGWGLLMTDAGQILGNSPLAWALAVPVGAGIGAFAIWSDRAIVRYFSRRSLLVRPRSSRRPPADDRSRHRDSHGVIRVRPVSTMSQPARSQLINPRGRNYLPDPGTALQSGWLPMVVVAVLEELVFRGLLVQACLQLPGDALIAAALIASVLIFALSHVSFGWAHVVGKLPLGAAALIGVLALGTVLPAIVAHALFNVRVWRDRINQPVFVGMS